MRSPVRSHLLGLVAVLLLLGSGGEARREALPSVDAAPPAVEARQPGAEAALARLLGARNPYLTPAQRERAARAVLRSSARYGLDPELVTAVILVESGARPWVQSPKGAVGLMQVMPYMARGVDVAGNYSTIETNVELGCSILADNIRRLGVEDGVSAYFWGSDIRGTGYLRKVFAERAQVRRELRS